eukprot:427400-Ditylum_brightwellii.AAC.1
MFGQNQLRLVDILIKRITKGTAAKWKTSKHLADITLSHDWLSISLSSLVNIRQDTRKAYFDLKKNDKKEWRTWVEDAAKEAEANNDLTESRWLHQLLHREKEHDRTLWLARLKGTGTKLGEKRVVVEKAQLDAWGNVLESPDGPPLTTLTEVTEKDKLEKACMEEVSQRSRISEKSPPIQPHL